MTAPLVQLSDVLNLMPGALSASDTATLTFLSGAVSDYARRFTGRDFWQTAYAETYRGRNNNGLFVRQTPIQSVQSLYVNNVPVPAASVDANGNPVLAAFGFWFTQKAVYLSGGASFPDSMTPNIVANYTAGYAAPNDYASLPQDLYLALCEEVVNQYRSLTRIGIVREQQQGQSAQFSAGAVLPITKAVLQTYRRTYFST